MLLVQLAWASPPEAEPWIATDVVAVGLNVDGSLCNPTLALCLLADPDGTTGPAPLGGDWIFPGNAFEVWSASYTLGGTLSNVVNGGPYTISDSTFTWDAGGTNPSLTWIHGTAAGDDLDIETWVEAPWGAGVVWLTLTITANQAVADLRVARVFDADPDAWSTGSYETMNDAGEGWAVAAGTFDGRALALAATGGAGGHCDWCVLADDLADPPPTPVESDGQVGIAVPLGDLAPGETASVTFAYGMAMGADAAVATAIEAAADDDHDRDGTAADADCDDRDPARAPGLPELADGVDNNCDGAVDESGAATDDDGDGYTEATGDCDDADPKVHPSASAGDADCDGVADEGWTPDVPPDTEGSFELTTGACATGATHPFPLAALLALALFSRRVGRRRAATPKVRA